MRVADEIYLESRTSLAARHFRPPGLPGSQSNMQNGFHLKVKAGLSYLVETLSIFYEICPRPA